MHYTNIFALGAALLASQAIAAPVAAAGGTAPGSVCSTEGKVDCSGNSFQVCASGCWSVKMSLAAGTDCSVFGGGSSGGDSSTPVSQPAGPTSTAPLSVPPTSTGEVFHDTTTSVPSQVTTTPAAGNSTLPASTISVPAPTGTTGGGSGSSTGKQNVVYWGQNGGGLIENNDLSHYCSADAGIDIVVLAFLYEYGNGKESPSGAIGQSCSITGGKGSNCDDLASSIATCQKNGKKVILSLGGATGAYSLSSQAEAESIAQALWDSYGKGGNGDRPFGDGFVNGFDFDIESNSGNQYYQYMIAKLRSNFASDSSNTYYITGAPQCPIPEPNMNEIITKAQFDYLFVQFYNNEGCSLDGEINFDDWKKNIAGTPSSKAEIFIGAPASPLGATGTQSGAKYYQTPAQMAATVAKYASDAAFGGIMMWAAAFSDANVVNGCTYAQEAHAILTTGKPC